MEDSDTSDSRAAIHFVFRLARLLRWLMFIGFHLVLWVAALTVFWAFDVSARDLLDWLNAIAASAPATFATALGLSALGVLAAYRKAAIWISKKLHNGWMWRYLTKGLSGI